MTQRTVAKVLLDQYGHLFIVPEIEFGTTYEYIYREANGLRWNEALRAIHASEPERWEHGELLRHVSETLKSAYGEELKFTQATTWEGVTPELKDQLRSTLL